MSFSLVDPLSSAEYYSVATQSPRLSSLFSSVCIYRLFLSVSCNHIVIRRLILASSDVPLPILSVARRVALSPSLFPLYAPVLYLPAPSARDGF